MKKVLVLFLCLVTITGFSLYPRQIKVTVKNENPREVPLGINSIRYISEYQCVKFNKSSMNIPYKSSSDVVFTVDNSCKHAQRHGVITISSSVCTFKLGLDAIPGENVFENIENAKATSSPTHNESCIAELASDSNNSDHFNFIILPYIN